MKDVFVNNIDSHSPSKEQPTKFIKIKDIVVKEKNRIREFSGKDISKLKESMKKKNGLINPITINGSYELISGFRRLTAAKELGWERIEVKIIKGLTELEEFDVQLDENIRRKDLDPYELDVALAIRKKMHEKIYPETTQGGYMKQHRKKRQKKLPKKKEVYHINSPGSFSKVTSEQLNMSVGTIKRHTKVGNAILNNELDGKVVEDYKNRKISHSKMLEMTKKNKKEKNKKENIVKKEKEYKKPKVIESKIEMCKNCNKSSATMCPCCGEQVLICDKGYVVLKRPNAQACKYFDNN